MAVVNRGITVAIPSIPPRSALLARAIASVSSQTLQPSGLVVAYDNYREGAPRTRQRALESVTTEWVAFLDDDDEFMPQHLEKLWNHALNTGADYVFAWYKVKCGDTVFDVDPVFPPTHYSQPWDPAQPRQTTITVLVKTDLALTAGFLPHESGKTVDGQTWGEDWSFTLKCNALGVISHLVDHTWYWHHDSANTSGRSDRW